MDVSKVSGRYHLVSQENYEEFLAAIGVDGEKKAKAMQVASHVDCQYHADTDEWYFIQHQFPLNQRIKFLFYY